MKPTLISKVKNYLGIFPKKQDPRNLLTYLTAEQMLRVRQDISTWRDAIREAESALYPFRVKMQNIFIDTILNGHVSSCMEKRKDLTLLKDYCFLNSSGKEDEKTTLMFKERWFDQFLNHALDANFYGYSLITLGDIVDGKFPNIEVVRRQNVNPDTKQMTSITYGVAGVNFLAEEFKDWCVYIDTPSENGISCCGYGLLYKVAMYEIFLRNTMGYNADYVELFGQPFRYIKSSKTDEKERGILEATLRDMGSSAYAILDPMDEFGLAEPKGGSGTGWQSYESFEKRCEAKISKLILGHADAMDSTPGKLGSNEAVTEALEDKEKKDVKYLEYVVNNLLIPKLRVLGIAVPEGSWKMKNDSEVYEQREKEDTCNKATAEIVKTLYDSGLEVDPKYITDRTMIPVKKIAQTTQTRKIQAKLDELYGV